MTRTYGVGIMGAGVISVAYLEFARLFRGLEVVAVADIVPELAQKRAVDFRIRAMSPEALLASEDVDIVVNLTPPLAHGQVTTDALSAGKHVHSEKPLAVTLEDALRIKTLAEARGLRVTSAPDTFLGGAHQQVRRLVDEGAIGRVTSGTCHVMSRGMEHWHPNPAFFFQPGAGPVLDVGPYYITELVQLLGPVRRVSAFANMARPERLVTAEGPHKGTTIAVGTPTTIHGLLEFRSGAIATLGASWDVAAHGHHNIELYGTEGTLFVPDPNFFGGRIVIADCAGERRDVPAWAHPLGKPNNNLEASPRANYRSAGLADLAAALESGRPARCGLDLAVHAVEVMTGLLRAAETAEVVTLTTTCERPAPLGPEEAQALMR